MTKANHEPLSCEGMCGQIINPGDKVIFMTVCSHSPSFGEGTYLGMVGERARIAEDFIKTTYHHPVTGKDITDWNDDVEYVREAVGRPCPLYPRISVWRNATVTERGMYEKQRREYDDWHAEARAARARRIERETPSVRNRLLINNVMFLKP